MIASAKGFLLIAAASGFVSVTFGAFGAHALRGRLDDYHLRIFHTGVEYQFYHTLALFVVGMLLAVYKIHSLRWVGWAFTFGIVLFSGSLYVLALTRVKAWGAVTPIGGAAFLVGWLLLFSAVWKQMHSL